VRLRSGRVADSRRTSPAAPGGNKIDLGGFQVNRHCIKVAARSQFQPEQSSPAEGRYVFAYTVVIENRGSESARLIDRHWIITDADGQIQEVRGQGVVGEQPHLRPGERFQYTSGTILPTPVGAMHGSYGMLGDDGIRFDAEIPAFSLASTTSIH
jgi:ApaG protein